MLNLPLDPVNSMPGAQGMLGPTGPAAPQSPNLGEEAEALSNVQQAVQLLQKQLPKFQVGSDQQKVIMDAVKKLSELAPASAAPQGVQVSSLDKMRDEAKQSAMLRMLLGSQSAPLSAPQPAGPPGTLPGMV